MLSKSSSAICLVPKLLAFHVPLLCHSMLRPPLGSTRSLVIHNDCKRGVWSHSYRSQRVAQAASRDADQPPQSDIPPRSLVTHTEQLIYQARRGVVQLIKAAIKALELFGGFPVQSREERQNYFHFVSSQCILSDCSVSRCDLEQSIRDSTHSRGPGAGVIHQSSRPTSPTFTG